VHAAFVTHGYPRWDGDIAGVFLERLAVALVDRGHEVTVVAPSDAGRGGEEQRRGVRVRRVRYAAARHETLAYRGTMIEAARSPVGAIAMATLLGRLAQVAAATRADLLHAHWWFPAGFATWMTAAVTGTRYVVTLHGTDVAILERAAAARVAARRVFAGAAAVTAVSSHLAERAGHFTGIDPRCILVQPMPVELDRFTEASRGGGGVVAVGRLTVQKRLAVALEAVARLRQRGHAIPMTIIGDGPERSRLEELRDRLDLRSQVRFLGQVDPSELPAVLHEADVLVFPARGEGLGLVAAEALCLGIPVVVASDGGGVRDVVPDTGGGRVVTPDDPDALASAVGDLLQDPTARARALEAGRALRPRFDARRVAERFEQLYATVVNGA
jgi:glycosyltransferase involved in cell wall biosynthesis